ncbi:MAG: pyridoxamine 5'-phosphate oxidase family protein [Nakamurella sp.]
MADDTGTTAKVAELAKDIRIAMLTTMDADGHHISRPMAQQEVEFDGDLWFFAQRTSRKVAHIRANPEVGVTLSSNDTWISIEGAAEIVDDRAKNKELWNAFVGAWFTDGPEDPDVVLIKINAHGAEYWDSPGGRIATVVSFVKAKVTGKPYDGGENEKVDL